MCENNSGHGEYTRVPMEVKKWNWGAFWLTWIWGIFNGSYIALLALLPIANFIMPFYLGAKGNELAWKNNTWYDVEQLHRTQKKWAIGGWITAIIFVSAIVNMQVERYYAAKESRRLTIEALNIIRENKEVQNLVGDIHSIRTLGRTGVHTSTDISYSHHSFIVESNNGLFYVVSDLEDNKNIVSIEVSRFGDNGKDAIKINLLE